MLQVYTCIQKIFAHFADLREALLIRKWSTNRLFISFASSVAKQPSDMADFDDSASACAIDALSIIRCNFVGMKMS
jgi:hypothetical protein